MSESTTENVCSAFLLRHGATDANLAHPPILQGRTIDGPLSSAGRQQAIAAGECLRDAPLSAIYSSPLLRARETAECVALPHSLSVRVIDEITEVDVGAWERRSWLEIETSEPAAFRAFQTDPAIHGYRNGENLQQVFDRVYPAIQRVLTLHAGESIAIIGHNVVNRVFLAAALDLPLSRARTIVQNNCGINLIRSRSEQLSVVTVNSIFHLKALPQSA